MSVESFEVFLDLWILENVVASKGLQRFHAEKSEVHMHREEQVIDIELNVADDRIQLTFIDSGKVFNPMENEQPGLLNDLSEGGMGILLVVAVLAWKGRFSAQNHNLVEGIGLYWHFVDIVWIAIFTIVYLLQV